jgi:hypothetical protein
MNQEQAEYHVEELQGYYAHVGAYVSVNLFLMVINYLNYEQGDGVWFVYPLCGWGIGLAAHTLRVFGAGESWRNRKIQELTGWSTTQDELERLSERTDNLIAILSSVNWADIDPELLSSKDNLVNAKEKISQLKQEGDSAEGVRNKEAVISEIEKLEKFVTSNKFSYYDQAASEHK